MPKPTDKVIRKSTNPITGLLHITGPHDTGKTLFALSSGAQPERTLYVDDDVKGRATVKQLKRQGYSFGRYVDLVKELDGLKELEVNARGIELINSIEEGQYDVVVWDTWSRMGASFFYVVKNNPNKYKQFYAPNSVIKMGEMSKVAKTLESKVISDLLDKVPLLILTTHLRDDYVNDKKTGRQVPDAKKTLEENSNFRVWLEHNPDGPEPIGLILKRPVKLSVSETGGIQPVNILPRKMKPFTWERVISYWNKPAGNSSLEPGDTLSEHEVSVLDGVLTADQKNVLKLATLEAEREAREAREMPLVSDTPAWVDDARAMIAKGDSRKMIADTLGVSIGEINRWSNNAQH